MTQRGNDAISELPRIPFLPLDMDSTCTCVVCGALRTVYGSPALIYTRFWELTQLAPLSEREVSHPHYPQFIFDRALEALHQRLLDALTTKVDHVG